VELHSWFATFREVDGVRCVFGSIDKGGDLDAILLRCFRPVGVELEMAVSSCLSFKSFVVVGTPCA
jgi:hypothetical protein